MWYYALTLMGILYGYLLRFEHSRTPLNMNLVILWQVISIYGLIFSNATPIFYFMTMVSIGWGACQYAIMF